MAVEKWDAETESALFENLIKFKPVGMHKHIRMFNLQRQLREATGRSISVAALWEKLRSLYNLDLLDELAEEDSDNESPDGNDEQIEFWLPPSVLDEERTLQSVRANVRRDTRRQSVSSPSEVDDFFPDSTKKPRGRGRGIPTSSNPATPGTVPQSPSVKDKSSGDGPGRRTKRQNDSPTNTPTSTKKTKR